MEIKSKNFVMSFVLINYACYAKEKLCEIEETLMEEWRNIPQHRIKNLAQSMPVRKTAALRARALGVESSVTTHCAIGLVKCM